MPASKWGSSGDHTAHRRWRSSDSFSDIFRISWSTKLAACALIVYGAVADTVTEADRAFVPTAISEILDKYYGNAAVAQSFGRPRLLLSGPGGRTQEKAVVSWLTSHLKSNGPKDGARCSGATCTPLMESAGKCPSWVYWSLPREGGSDLWAAASSAACSDVPLVGATSASCGDFSEEVCFEIERPGAAERDRLVQHTLNRLPSKRFGDLSESSIKELVDSVFDGLSFDQIEMVFWGALAEAGEKTGVALRHFELGKTAIFGAAAKDEAVKDSSSKDTAGQEEKKKKKKNKPKGAWEEPLLKEVLPEALHFPPIIWGLLLFAIVAHLMTSYMTSKTKGRPNPLSASRGARGGGGRLGTSPMGAGLANPGMWDDPDFANMMASNSEMASSMLGGKGTGGMGDGKGGLPDMKAFLSAMRNIERDPGGKGPGDIGGGVNGKKEN
ncbi:unnamed protein product [Amoebophrya sp. A25]|nr:unnamed protein product [Amoebophrya sp. A25]|eukprot:GSA25T00015303001.1